MSKPYIDELKEGDPLVSFFAVRRKEIRLHEETPFLLFELGDKTGRIQATIWEDMRPGQGSVNS